MACRTLEGRWMGAMYDMVEVLLWEWWRACGSGVCCLPLSCSLYRRHLIVVPPFRFSSVQWNRSSRESEKVAVELLHISLNDLRNQSSPGKVA